MTIPSPAPPIAYLSEDGTRIFVHASPLWREAMKTIPGATYKAQQQVWSLSLGWPTALALRATFPDLIVDDSLIPWSWEARRNWEFRCSTKETELQTLLPLYPFQRLGSSFLAFTKTSFHKP